MANNLVKDAHYNRAKIFYNQGKFGDAKNEVEKALKIDPNYIFAIELLQDINNRLRKRSTPAPIEKKRTSTRQTPTPIPKRNDFKDALHRIATTSYQNAQELLKTINWKKNWKLYLASVAVIAIVLIFSVVRSNTPSRPIERKSENETVQKPIIPPIDYAKIGDNHLENKEYNKAIDALQKAISNNQGDEKVYNSLGIAYYNTRNYNAAITAFQDGITLNPELKHLHHNLGWAYFKVKQFSDAKKSVEKALEIDPNYESARQLLEAITKELEPKLSIEQISFIEPSGEGFLDAGEKAHIKFTVSNNGSTVNDVTVWLRWDSTVGLRYNPQTIPTLHENESETIIIPITASQTVKGKKDLKMEIQLMQKTGETLVSTAFNLTIRPLLPKPVR